MKANAPEKIYLFENPITEAPDDRWLSKKSGDTDIEYTRTDAFIEKAEEYIYKQLNEGCIECGDIVQFIGGMKNYIKGEQWYGTEKR